MVVMSDPATWPLCDLLPLTRPDPNSLWPEMGVLIAERGPTLFLANAFEPGLWKRLANCPRIEFQTFEELSAAGWRVD